jgi:hypoxanthine-DNA glycosylase
MRAFADERTRLLVVGSLPGQASLASRQYYAQPQNSFWRIVEDLYAIERTLPYRERMAALLDHGIGVWDVCASAQRPGSLDASIVRGSIVPNDFGRLFRRYPGIALACFNGATAAGLYRRLVLPSLLPPANLLRTVVLPSTSPAHAGMRYAEKLARWRSVLSGHAC